MAKLGFGVIQNNIALKQSIRINDGEAGFWSHTKQHSSKTRRELKIEKELFWSHTKQHSSKTSNAKNGTVVS